MVNDEFIMVDDCALIINHLTLIIYFEPYKGL